MPVPTGLPPEITSELLEQYWAGTCSPSERRTIESWVAADPERRAFLESLRTMHDAMGRLLPDVDSQSAWARVAPSLRGLTGNVVIARPEGPKQSPRGAAGDCFVASLLAMTNGLRGLAMTAAVVGCAVLVAMAVGISYRGQSHFREFATQAGQRESVTLSDGTRFTLAPGSRLRLPVDYAAGNRAVSLEGEAFFAVVHDAAHPFSVRAANVVITDVGTQFDVRGYASDQDVRVAVAEGRVGIAAGLGTVCDHPCATASTMASRGDVAVVRATAVAVTHGVDVASVTAWTAGRFVFRDGTLSETAADLGRWYNLDVVVDRSLRGRHLVGSLSAGSADDALHVVAGALDVRVTRDGRRVTISPRN